MLPIPVLAAPSPSFWWGFVPDIIALSFGLMPLHYSPWFVTCLSDSKLSLPTHLCLWVSFQSPCSSYLRLLLAIHLPFSGDSVLLMSQHVSFGSWTSERMDPKFHPVGPPWFIPMRFITPLWVFSCSPRAQPTEYPALQLFTETAAQDRIKFLLKKKKKWKPLSSLLTTGGLF